MTTNLTTTTTAGATESFLSGKLHHVDLARIEKELVELWKQAEDSEGGEMNSVTRACSFNFILFTEDGADASVSDLLDDIMLSHPCRAILASAKAAEEESLDAWVSARCHVAGGNKRHQICCEQITVSFLGEGTEKIASVVLPLTMGDLPTCLWWKPGIISMSCLEPFLPDVDRLIVDSGDDQDSVAELISIKSVHDRLPKGAGLYDLNWKRILPWRLAIAHAFEESRGPLKSEDLDLISQVQIKVAGADVEDGKRLQLSQALLLAGWLATRLAWQPAAAAWSDDGGIEVSYKVGRRKIPLAISRVPLSSIASGSVCEVRIGFMGRESEQLVVRQPAGSPSVEAEVLNSAHVTDHVDDEVFLRRRSDSELVGDVLNDPTREPIYGEALLSAFEVLDQVR
ncbi:MAG: glucose-6-phosphate dehydrogenase assembly protein OpcA [Cyanobacteria bacterium]|nr:glucose-6-phosphate dehydrogenase assembly protein OpcA [Cyanobacteriota bacterium]